jgi:uncharacterized protein YceH (UPF0502 family)
MMTESTPPPAATAAETPSWPVLARDERRVLGVLVEKAKTTPDAYPLTLNALITGCNQKNNRDPVLTLQDADVEEAVAALKKHGLVQQITGSGRADKFRHVIYDTWRVDKVQVAILGELLLRGPQTEGELRGRASRMEPIPELDLLRSHLKTLAQRRLVVYLTPEGRRGTIVTHGFHAPDELARLKSRAEAAADSAAEPAPASAPARSLAAGAAGLEQRLETVETELAALKRVVAELQARLAPGGLTAADKMD